MASARASWLVFAALVAIGCSDDDPGASSSATTGAGGAGGAATGASSAGGSGNYGGSGLPPCDGAPQRSCNGGTFCDAAEGCPSADNLGTCELRPEECTDEGPPACACDGQVYESACAANLAGYDIDRQASCTAPRVPFLCGAVLCEEGEDYCQSFNGHETCQPLPAECLDRGATCDCLAEVICRSAPGETECELDAEGHFVVSCVITE